MIRNLFIHLALCCSIAIGASIAFAGGSLTEIHSNEYGIEWHPKLDYEGATLTVSGPNGLQVRQEFDGSTIPYFDFYDENETLRPDGLYSYELTFLPFLDPQTEWILKVVSDWSTRADVVEQLKKQGKIPDEELVESGYFSFIDGGALTGDGPKGADSDEPLPKDFVINDDNIVIGGQCVGFDCVNGESFGFDTLRLKENNLRIKFDDTSNSASFPRNDWQITANDSNNGGAERFSIEDITGGRIPFTIRAGAPSNSLYLDAQGDLGLGTNNPIVDLHVVSGDTPTVRLEQNGSSGWTPQTWDLAGNETNFFLRDVTNGSKLPFRVRPGAPQNSIFVDTDGDVGLGTSSPEGPLHINRGTNTYLLVDPDGEVGVGTNDPLKNLHIDGGASDSIIRVESSGDDNHSGIEFSRQRLSGGSLVGGAIWVTGDSSTNHSNLILQSNSSLSAGDLVGGPGKRLTLSTTNGFIFENGNVGISNTSPSNLLEVGSGGAICNGTNWIDGSSRNFKKKIQPLNEEELKNLYVILDEVRVVQFLYNSEEDSSPPRVGMIAEEMPETLASSDRKGLELGRHIGFLMGVVKAMRNENIRKTAEINGLKSRIENLESLLLQNDSN